MDKNKIIVVLVVIVIMAVIFEITRFFDNKNKVPTNTLSQIESRANQTFVGNIIKETEENNNFRKVLFTGTRSQLVVMSIPVGGEVGEETHSYTEQTLFFLGGRGKAILNGEETLVSEGDIVVVTAGTKHNFINTGTIPLKIYTVYAPPNHIEGTIHATKADADKDIKDEDYGNVPK